MQARPSFVTGASGKPGSRVAVILRSANVIYLALAGLLLLSIGGAILLVPHAFHGNNGIELGTDPTFLSEVRAPGGLLAGSAILALASVFRPDLRALATQLLVLVYGSFGIARLASIVLDGMPADSIIGAMITELVVAAIGVAICWLQRSGAE